MTEPQGQPQRVEIVGGVWLGVTIFFGWLLGAIVLTVVVLVVAVAVGGDPRLGR